MDLIDYYYKVLQNQYLDQHITYINFQKQKSQSWIYFQKQTIIQIIFQIYEVDKIKQYKIIVKLLLNLQKKYIRLNYSLIGQDIYKASNQFLKTFLLRKIIQMNTKHKFNKLFVILFHPRSGQLSLRLFFNINFDFILTKLDQFIDSLNNLMYQLQDIIKLFTKILYTFQSEYLKLLQLRNYIIHSNKYSWMVLTNSTSRRCKLDQYEQMKQYFCKIIKFQKFDEKIIYNILRYIYNKSIFVDIKYSEIPYHHDTALRIQYLNKHQQIGMIKENLIQKITIDVEAFELLKNNKRGKISCGTQGRTFHVVLTEFPPAYEQKLVHHKFILQKLQKQKFSGLPTYFYLSNLQNQSKYCRITDLYFKTMSILVYLEKNAQTISIFTKMNFLTQIIITLYQIKNKYIVFNNLYPSNIYIKRYFCKFVDFSNSYHFSKVRKFEFQNNFPYVLQYQYAGINSENQDQRFDVFSYCCLLYLLIFNKKIINIRKSKIDDIKEKSNVFPIENINITRLLSLQYYKYDGIFQLIQFLCLRGYCFMNQRQIIQDRPYLDWMVIIIKMIQKYFNNLADIQ